MRSTLLFVAVLVGALLCGCAGSPLAQAPMTRVSADYEAAGNLSGVRAFVYGKRTVLTFDRRPLRLTIHDENGVAVSYEREGAYYRMSRQLDRFTVWANTRVLSFNRNSSATPPAAIAASATARAERKGFSSPLAATSASPIHLQAAPASDQQAASLAQLFTAQRDAVRQVIASDASSTAEARALTARLERAEARRISGAATMIRVQFDVGATDLTLDEQFIRTLLPAAMTAERIHIEGHTGAHTEGRDDLRIALVRARATRDFLVAQGVDGRKISIAARPAGDFLVPAETEQGRALNRRAEIELVHRRDDD